MPWIPVRSAIHGTAIALALLCVCACGGGGGGGGRRIDPPPAFGSLAFSTKQNIDLSGQLAATDPQGQTLTFTKMSDPASGTVTSFTAAGAFAYRPKSDFSGSDSFQVQVRDTAGNTVTGTVAITVRQNNVPVAVGDVLRADGAALDAINVKANDTDADGDALTVAIEGTPLIGTATVNTDGTVRVAGLPADFKGVTTFKYRITDTSGGSAVGSVAVFIGSDPFRVLFAGDSSGNGSVEVYLDDFVSSPKAISAATSGTLRLKGFVASENGATVVYRRQDSGAGTSDLTFVSTSAPSTQQRITLPAGTALVQGASGEDQFRVSPDGKWIAFVAGSASANKVYLVGTNDATAAKDVSPAGTLFVRLPRFSDDSTTLYFLASATAGGGNKSLYAVQTANSTTTVPISAISTPQTSDDVVDYAVAADQSRILLQANRGGRVGLYFVDPLHLQTELQVSQTLAADETIRETTVSLPAGAGGSSQSERVAYTVESSVTFSTWVADVSATPTPRLIASAGARVIGFRPDNDALLYTQGAQIKENIIDSGGADQSVAPGAAAWYDSTGNILLIKQFLPSGGSPSSYPALAVTSRGAFGNTQPVGAPVLAAHYINVTGFDRGVALIGQGPTTGTPPASARLALVNALSPDKLLFLADFSSPLQMTSDIAQVATY
jgi:hypothetical protein